jgi:hypothetical protein
MLVQFIVLIFDLPFYLSNVSAYNFVECPYCIKISPLLGYPYFLSLPSVFLSSKKDANCPNKGIPLKILGNTKLVTVLSSLPLSQ